ncbi:GNAT family N-acetyltransferase [Sanguibacter keddieii]|uniref:GNAT family N-acetyltransferase n=1 Tax=Sanguibacter keddieii TaxID=60920 RepID=UPI0005A60989|nr:GNAT family protein [Sanguibacter keddieii]
MPGTRTSGQTSATRRPTSPVTLTLVDLPEDGPALVDLVSSHEYPFHVRRHPTRADVESRLVDGSYLDEDHATYWVDHATEGRIGVVTLEDLSDDTPMLDLRLVTEARGLGLGQVVLEAVTDLVFTTMPEARRFEGQTREDNVAMRKTFLRSGFLKEAHYREGWPVDGGAPLASVAYAILRRDWESGTTTPFVWEDLEA